MKGHKSF